MNTTTTLDALAAGESAYIVKVGGEGALRRRLLDMGLTPGTFVTVRRKAPLGDPIEINLRGYELTLRADEAHRTEVRRTEHRSDRKPELR